MLGNRLVEIIREVYKYQSRINNLEEEYRGKTKGAVYQKKADYLYRYLDKIKKDFTTFGRHYPAVSVEGEYMELFNSIQVPKKFKVYFTGISKEEALELVKLEKPTATNLLGKNVPIGIYFSR